MNTIYLTFRGSTYQSLRNAGHFDCCEIDLGRKHQHKQGVNAKIFINHIKECVLPAQNKRANLTESSGGKLRTEESRPELTVS